MGKQWDKSFHFSYKFTISLFVMAAMFITSIVFGAADIRVTDVFYALFSTNASGDVLIIQEIRLPREVAAMLVGAGLAVAGAIMQGMTRNPLADPGLLGLTAGANAALAVTIVFLPAVGYFGIMVACFIGASVGAGLVFGVASLKRGGFSPFRIVLAGAAISAFFQAIAEGIGIYFQVSKEVSMWTAGGLIGTNWDQIQMVVPFIAIGMLLAILFSRQLTILSLDEEVAVGLGQNTTLIKAVLFVLVIILTGASVALVGNMTFIGLMVPHIVRAIVGKDYRFIIPMSIAVGASFMLFADTIGRTVNAPWETPVAAIISVIGLPFFLYIVRKGGKVFV